MGFLLMDKTYIIDQFVNTQAGEPFRLFPFGVIVKNGNRREITLEFARQIKLPHFKPPIKLGSHDDITPAGGHIVGLEVRQDGLYAIPEWNENGIKAMREGAYRYHSPEIIWQEGAIEDPTSGEMMNGPLIIGDALLHAPHLGESAALYETVIQEKNTMADETITLPKNLWEQYIAPLFAKPEPQRVEIVPEDYEATKKERDELKAKIEAQEAEVKRAARREKYEAELTEAKAEVGLAELLADLPEDKAGEIMRQFKALSAQIDESKLTEKGTEGTNTIEDPKAAFNAAVLALANEKKILYTAAFEEAKVTHADLFAQAFKK